MPGIPKITLESQDYHFKFQAIKAKPHQIYYEGDLSILNKPIFAIVGPRRPSAYAEQVLRTLFESVKDYDIVIVSGLAPGVDQLAHRFALDNNIPTIAVLGGGISHYKQRIESKFIDKIVSKGGLVLSEFDLDQIPQTYTFPQRNRIIAGLSDLVFLPEAGKKSGSLLTVDFANMMNKPVYGTPQSIFSRDSEGLLEYLQDGKIKPVADLSKLLQQYFGWRKKITTQLVPTQTFSNQEKIIIDCLSEVPDAELSEIAYHLEMPVDAILTQLTMLELKNLVYQPSPGIYKIATNNF